MTLAVRDPTFPHLSPWDHQYLWVALTSQAPESDTSFHQECRSGDWRYRVRLSSGGTQWRFVSEVCITQDRGADSSLKYHRLHPEYIHTRIEKMRNAYKVRILLILCDIVSTPALLA